MPRRYEPALYQNRAEGGRKLAQALSAYNGRSDVVVLGLPRGGVPVAFEVAKELDTPLDVFIVRKLGVPGHKELAMGAIASGGVRVLNRQVIQRAGVSETDIDAVAQKEHQELENREAAYRGERPGVELAGKTAILVDDGIATGASMRAAIQGLREHDPRQIIVAVPTAPAETCRELEKLADEVVCLETPSPYGGVGAWFREFAQTSNDEVRDLLEQASKFGSD